MAEYDKVMYVATLFHIMFSAAVPLTTLKLHRIIYRSAGLLIMTLRPSDI